MDKEQLDMMRHSFAHVMMQALRRLYKDAIPGVGPSIEDGFYHDFEASHKVSEEDLKNIEKEMKKIIKEDLPIEKRMLHLEDARKHLGELGYTYTQAFLDDVNEGGGKEVSFYTQGEFENMCRGPHVESTGKLNPKAFKLIKVAGAYFRGDEKQPMLQRIYGVAFETAEELKEHLHLLEEAKKRDHKKLGRELDLFTFSELVGSGLPLWTTRGTMMRNILDDYVWSLRKKYGYEKVEIPHITKKDLYEKSGHWDKFKDELFTVETREGHVYALKPMNCPHHTQIYDSRPRSYKELPQRYANTTMVYRDEQSGELSGLSRVLSISQDDAHVFCREDQIKDEMNHVWDIIETFYKTVGFEDLQVRLSYHDPENREAYLGGEERWQKAEGMLKALADEKEVDYVEQPGEAAFYGPKIDFVAKDSLKREWQVATIQVDMNMPENFDLTCVNEEGKKERVVMIHAAIMGSIERFMSILIEHYAGAFPTWLSPVQVALIPVGEAHIHMCQELHKQMKEQDIRSEVDESNETVGRKIRKAVTQKIPYMIVIGDKEVQAKTVSVRKRGSEEMESMTQEEFIAKITEEINLKAL